MGQLGHRKDYIRQQGYYRDKWDIIQTIRKLQGQGETRTEGRTWAQKGLHGDNRDTILGTNGALYRYATTGTQKGQWGCPTGTTGVLQGQLGHYRDNWSTVGTTGTQKGLQRQQGYYRDKMVHRLQYTTTGTVLRRDTGNKYSRIALSGITDWNRTKVYQVNRKIYIYSRQHLNIRGIQSEVKRLRQNSTRSSKEQHRHQAKGTERQTTRHQIGYQTKKN